MTGGDFQHQWDEVRLRTVVLAVVGVASPGGVEIAQTSEAQAVGRVHPWEHLLYQQLGGAISVGGSVRPSSATGVRSGLPNSAAVDENTNGPTP